MQNKEYLYGIHTVQAAIEQKKRPLFCLYYKEDAKVKAIKNIIELANQQGCESKAVTPAKLGQLSGSKYHQGIVLEAGEILTYRWKNWIDQHKNEKRLLLLSIDQVNDPQNLGAIMRSALFLGASALLYAGQNLSPLSPSVSKASSGAMEILPIIKEVNLGQALRDCQKENFWIIGADMDENAKAYQTIEPLDRSVLVMGNEGEGLRHKTKQICDIIASIKGSNLIDSLNVSAATAVLLAHFAKDIVNEQ